MLLATLALWPLQGDAAGLASGVGLALVYLAGGLPAGWQAAVTLWEEHILDIDLLMVVAAVAAAAVGAADAVQHLDYAGGACARSRPPGYRGADGAAPGDGAAQGAGRRSLGDPR